MTQFAELTAIEDIKTCVMGSHAKFTLESNVSGMHLTYKVWGQADTTKRFVSVLSGPDEWTYVGMLIPQEDKTIQLCFTKKSIKQVTTSARTLTWFLRHLNAGNTEKLAQVQFLHSGKCCRCGRTLTTPGSIAAGIGPVCAARPS